MKQYTSYKDSGIAWIGKIPSHWETDKIGVVQGSILSTKNPKTRNTSHKKITFDSSNS